ncbi:DUF4192 domain-containing protein [Isoptericola sp. b515]|uniref:DUF4192 domain-containing protein n=1 Tax=Isoptericola sp. b515 TaxID=3064652 RepID=UPI0027140B8A|nr:DUF4192 domain-containing protein [Isoptericola sp. b515]MDO8148833.1 DUF4192 domain-containing protein [Isoptericola sp. b515]
MTTTCDPAPDTVRLRDAHDLLAAVPYRLGFRPTESVVLACVTASGRLGLVARVGLPDLAGPGDVTAGLEPLTRAVADVDPTFCLLALYTAGEVAAAMDRVEAVRRVVAPTVEVDRWLVTPHGYRGLDCDDVACCPPGGFPTAALEHGPVGAAHVLAGRALADSAEEAFRLPAATAAARGLAARAARRRESARPTTGDEEAARRWRGEAWSAWRSALGQVDDDPAADPALGPALLGRVGAGLADRRVRDAALLSLLPRGDEATAATVEGVEDDEAGAARAMASVVDPDHAVAPDPARLRRGAVVLEQVVAHVPRRLQAPPLTLLAFLAWWQGDGPRAARRVEGALAVDATYRLARLVHGAVSAGLPPGWVRADQRADGPSGRPRGGGVR